MSVRQSNMSRARKEYQERVNEQSRSGVPLRSLFDFLSTSRCHSFCQPLPVMLTLTLMHFEAQ